MTEFAEHDEAANKTEQIMWRFSYVSAADKGHILSLDPANYNRVFEAIYAQFKSNAAPPVKPAQP